MRSSSEGSNRNIPVLRKASRHLGRSSGNFPPNVLSLVLSSFNAPPWNPSGIPPIEPLDFLFASLTCSFSSVLTSWYRSQHSNSSSFSFRYSASSISLVTSSFNPVNSSSIVSMFLFKLYFSSTENLSLLVVRLIPLLLSPLIHCRVASKPLFSSGVGVGMKQLTRATKDRQ
eukprot:GHVS01092981.1.p1 GENE.GHVS01092981.1~~GHVS01092981.1.p1  ORF type:complete len:172 (-),score=9.35 GHVS01092981.1:84-599(-)